MRSSLGGSINSGLASLLFFTLAPAAEISDTELATACHSVMHEYTSPGVTLVSAKVIAAGQRNPAYCKIFGTITIDIGFEVRLPVDWNGRFYMVGNEGSGGRFNERNMGTALRMNYATASTDQGYDGAVEGDSYGYNNRQKVIDYGFRATHLSALAAESVIEAYYDTPAAYSYFVAGSAGARQALMEAQRFPDDFDGILLSAPVHNITKVHMWGLWKAKAFSGTGHIDPAKLPALAKAVYKECDDDDGVLDGVISDPLSCRFEPDEHLQLCEDSPTSPDCFTAAQIAALVAVYNGVRNSKGDDLFAGQPVGAEARGDMPPWMRTDGPESAWNDWMLVPAGETPRYLNFAKSFLRYMAFDIDNPDYDWTTFDFDSDPLLMAKASDIMDADDPDLRQFQASGGKMIHYHHWADTAVPATNSIEYFEQVQEVTGNTSDFYKFYLVPGGFHGSQGVGATHVSWLDTIIDWVENGNAPGELVATRDKDGETVFSRKICPYPLRGSYKGSGDETSADNFECVQ